MTQAAQKIVLSPSRDIPFNKLVLSQSNVRLSLSDEASSALLEHAEAPTEQEPESARRHNNTQHGTNPKGWLPQVLVNIIPIMSIARPAMKSSICCAWQQACTYMGSPGHWNTLDLDGELPSVGLPSKREAKQERA